ncbi:MAG: cyclic nucleotide-binding domain-containing protein [Cyanobium sp.]
MVRLPLLEDAMGVMEIWLRVLLGSAVSLVVARVCRARSLPRPPLRLLLAALFCWGLTSLLPLAQLPSPYGLGLGMTDDLLLAFAAVRLLVWATLELPGGLRWWPSPPDLLIQLVSLVGWALAAVLVVREIARFDLVNLVATSAVLTAVIGLAGQEGLKDLFSGLELQMSDDFAIGDWLELADGRRGIVVSISWRETTMRTMEDCLLVVPNSRITSDIFINRSRFGVCSNRFELTLAYDFPPAQALSLLQQLVRQHPQVLDQPPPQVRLKAFLDSSICYELQVWQHSPGERAQFDLRSQLKQQIWYALHRSGQSFPYPVREIRSRRASPRADQPASLSPAGDGSDETCLRILASVPMFSDLQEDQLRLLLGDSRLLTFGPGEAVVLEGAEGNSLYCLLQGRVDVCKRRPDGQEVSVRELDAGDVFGEMTLFLNAPRSATVRTLEECLLLRLGRRPVAKLLEENPALLDRIAALVSARQAELQEIGRDAQQQHTNAMLETMKRLFSVVGGSGGGHRRS